MNAAQESAGEAAPAASMMGKIAMIVGASRGLGRAIALAFAQAGAQVIAVSRGAMPTKAVTDADRQIRHELADASLESTPAMLLDRHRPDIVVLVAGAIPPIGPLPEQTWETFSANWHVDVKIAFHWLQAILRMPLHPGARVVVVSSGAAIGGSPLSGGYAGAKATQRFVAQYAQDEAKRAGLDITISTVLPRLSPTTGVGEPAIRAYAERAGVSVDEYLETFRRSFGPLVTPEGAGRAIVALAAEQPAAVAPAYLLTGGGLQKLG